MKSKAVFDSAADVIEVNSIGSVNTHGLPCLTPGISGRQLSFETDEAVTETFQGRDFEYIGQLLGKINRPLDAS